MAEKEGFEPPEAFTSTVFKTAAFDRSATSPMQPPCARNAGRIQAEGKYHTGCGFWPKPIETLSKKPATGYAGASRAGPCAVIEQNKRGGDRVKGGMVWQVRGQGARRYSFAV